MDDVVFGGSFCILPLASILRFEKSRFSTPDAAGAWPKTVRFEPCIFLRGPAQLAQRDPRAIAERVSHCGTPPDGGVCFLGSIREAGRWPMMKRSLPAVARVAIGHESNMSEKLARSLLITVSAMIGCNWQHEKRRRKQPLTRKQQRGDSDWNGHFCSHPAAVFERGGSGGEFAPNQAGPRASETLAAMSPWVS